MRYFEIITEENVPQNIRDQLALLLGVFNVKGIKVIPLEQVLSSIEVNGMRIDTDDENEVKQVIDIILSIDNLVDKVQDDMVVLNGGEIPQYAPSDDRKSKDEKKIKSKAEKTAKKNIKDGS